MKTKILFFLNSQTILYLEKNQTTPVVLAALTQGDWQIFNPIDRLIPDNLTPERIQIHPFGSWLVVRLPDQVSPASTAAPDAISLSPRQREVLDYLSQGYTSKQIAFKLHLSRRTVNLHIAAIKQKLETQTSAQSVGRATALGYCRQVMRRREP